MKAEAAGQESQYLSFYVSGGEYALGILQVREIIPYCDVTRLPGVPSFIRGVINLRGDVVPVLDLAIRFRLSASQPTKRASIVIAEIDLGGELGMVGLIADGVNQVLELAPADVEPPPSFGIPVGHEVLDGVGKVDGRFVLLLDLAAVIGDEFRSMEWGGTPENDLQSDPRE